MKYILIIAAQVKSDMEKRIGIDTEMNIHQVNFQYLYWADGVSEILFAVPALNSSMTSSVSCILTMSSFKLKPILKHFFTLAPFHQSSTQCQSLENQLATEERQTSASKRVTKNACLSISEVKTLVVWCESFEDHCHFPVGKSSPLYHYQ